MNAIARFFVENNKFTLVLSLAALLFGLSGLLTLTSESFPDVNIGTAIISTYYDGATASDIETKITKPLEEEIRRVKGLKKVKSLSQAGTSRIVTVVDIDNYEVEEVISDLQRAVDRATGLPQDLLAPPAFFEVKSEEFPVIELAVLGSNVGRLRDEAADLLKEELEDNKKISNVLFYGFRERRFNIFLNLELLKKNHVAINEVMMALQKRNITVPGGKLEKNVEQQLLRIESKALSAEELGEIIVRSNFAGQSVQIKDIARVEDSSEDIATLARYNGQPATILTISKKAGADIVDLSQEIKQKLEEFKQKYKGELDFIVFNDEGIRVGNRVDVLSSNAVVGLVLVVFFLLLFMPGWVGIVTSLSLPLAIMITVGMLPVMGMSINTITIIAMVIAIGMLVDNAVVISENFTRLREEGVDSKEAILQSIRDLWVPVSATAFTTIAAFMPMLVTSGVLGQFIRGIPIVVSLALLISLLESFFLLPARLNLIGNKVRVKKNDNTDKKDWFVDIVQPRFVALMAILIRFRYLVLIGFIGSLVLSIVLMAVANKLILFPADQTEIYLGRLELPQGSRIEVTDEVAADVMTQIKESLGSKLAHMIVRVGAAETDPMDPKGRMGAPVALIMMFVTDETKNNVPTNEVLADLREIKHSKLKRLSFEALVNGPPIGDPLDVTFRSNSEESLKEVSKRVVDYLSEINGVFDVKTDQVSGDDEVLIEMKYDLIARLGLTPFDVGSALRVAIAGQKIGDVNLKNREVDYFLRLRDEDRQDLNQLGQVKILDPVGNLISLSSLAEFKKQSGQADVKRYDFRRAITVTANINDEVVTSVEVNAKVEEFFGALKNDFKDVTLTFGGEGENTKESFQSLVKALVLSIVGIFALLVLIFRSYLRPFIILTTIPLGLVGFSIAFYLHDRPISFMALIGVIGLGGIIVNSGIVLISFIEQMRQESQLDLHEILAQASMIRLRAVVVTSLTTISGLLPTAYGIGGSDEFIIPLTMALAWGLTSGTILTLVWVPCAYAILEDITLLSKKSLRVVMPRLS